MHRPLALIIGGGPAGASAAIRLAAYGMRPLLLERSAEPQDALCGGFLSWATVARLKALGVDPEALGGRQVDRVRIVSARREALIPLPGRAVALSRFRLDQALLGIAEAAGARIERGCTVKAIEPDHVRLANGDTVEAYATVIATGKHDLRGAGARRSPLRMAGLRWRLAPLPGLDAALDRTIELHLFDGGYAGLVRQEDGVNLCLAVAYERLRAAEGMPDVLLASLAKELPLLGHRLDGAASVSVPQATANIPYGWQATHAAGEAFRIGDQCAVIASLAGEGIAIALASGDAAARAICSGVQAEEFQREFARRSRRCIRSADILWRWMERPRHADLAICCMAAAPPLLGLAARMTRL